MLQLLDKEEFVKSNLENVLKEEIDNCLSLEETLRWMQIEFENEFMIKLRERELQIKEDYQKKFEERMKNISKNLSYENSLRERNHLSRLERKIDEIADFEDYFLRARSRKHDVGK